jgi:hypothetical protein
MRKLMVVAAAAICCGMSGDVGADQLTTEFQVVAQVNGVRYVEEVPTRAGFHWVLPYQLSDWSCFITPTLLSQDGQDVYHNVSCSQVNTTLVVGMTLRCPARQEGSDQSSFFIRAGEANLEVAGMCNTHRLTNPGK